MRELHYRFGAPALGHHPGHHRSTRGDSGFEFRGHVPLIDAPDPRRLDLHASLRDPFGNWLVRVYSRRNAIAVFVVADLSASMGFAGACRKIDVLADFVECLAWSAWRTGDSFGFVGCDARLNDSLLLPHTHVRGAAVALTQALRALPFDGREGRSTEGLLLAHRCLSRQRGLVFLVSDFHLPPGQIEAVLASMAHHELVPVVLWDALEFDLGTRPGLAHAVDPESGRRRLVWWRPALRDQWLAAQQQRRDELLRIFRTHRVKPLFIEGAFDADAVTRHFHA